MADPNQIAEKIAAKARDTLEPLAREMLIMKWPAEFRAIMWGAVAQHAGILAVESDAEHKGQAQADKTRE